jgi:putative NADPH-quinone reductase
LDSPLIYARLCLVTRISILQAHPDAAGGHLCHALADAYEKGAIEAGHEVRKLDIAKLEFPLLRSQAEFASSPQSHDIEKAQEAIRWAQHLVIVFPLWHGTMPALLKAFLEQVFRPGFALDYGTKGFPKKLLGGRSARIVVTMGMPVLLYRWYFRAHGLRGLEQSILAFAGIKPIRESLFGRVEAVGDATRRHWLDRMYEHGRRVD